MANLSEQDVERIIFRVFGQMFGNKDIEYLPTNETCLKLNYPSPKQLRKAVEDGVLRIGKEVQDRRSSNSTRAIYYFNIKACIKRLDTPPEKRA